MDGLRVVEVSAFVAAPINATIVPMIHIVAPTATVRDPARRVSRGVLLVEAAGVVGSNRLVSAQLAGGTALIRTVLAVIRY